MNSRHKNTELSKLVTPKKRDFLLDMLLYHILKN